MNCKDIVRNKKINILLIILMTSALVLGTLTIGYNVFAVKISGIHLTTGNTTHPNREPIFQGNNANSARLCISDSACNNTTNIGNANSGINTDGQTSIGQ